MVFIRLIILVVILNVLRYTVIGFIEAPLILPILFDQMAEQASYFNTEFTTMDWITSYFYNFVMWLITVCIFHLMHPVLKGNFYSKSLKVFGIMWIFFASVSAIYMNHYSHPRDFYIWNIIDAILVFALLSQLNGFLYPIVMKKK